jgi:ParB-like chromosome segregation protein Spo0J
MSGSAPGADDGDLLVLLTLVDVHKKTFAEAGARLGLSRSAVAGYVRRITLDTLAAEEAPLPPGEVPAQKPENLDGGMPERWWQEGLRARRGVA